MLCHPLILSVNEAQMRNVSLYILADPIIHAIVQVMKTVTDLSGASLKRDKRQYHH